MKAMRDKRLQGLIEGVVISRALSFTTGTVFLIDRHYQIRQEITGVGDLWMQQAKRARQQLLQNDDLLAMVVVGDPITCEYHPANGEAQGYALSMPWPQVTWIDPNSEYGQAAIQEHDDIWNH